jgi:hypothetical protein
MEARMTPPIPPVQHLRNDAENAVKGAAWLARRAELLLANIRDGREITVATDAAAAALEARQLCRAFERLAIIAGADVTALKEALT